MSILLPVRFTGGRKGIYTPPPDPITPFCEIDLNEYVYARKRTWHRYVACMDWAPDGLTVIYGTVVDRTIEIRYNPFGTPFDISTMTSRGRMWPDQPGGVQGRNNCIGIQWVPGGNSFIAAHSNNGGAGNLVEWGCPSSYWFNDVGPALYLDPGQPTLLKIQSTTNLNPGHRVNNFRLHANGQDMLGSSSFSGSPLMEWRLSTPWDVSTWAFVSYDNPSVNTGVQSEISRPDGNCVYRRSGNNLWQRYLTDPWKPSPISPVNQVRNFSAQFVDRIESIYINRNTMVLSPFKANVNVGIFQYDRVGP